MASPQLEKGYLKIANELAEALAKNQFTGHENRVIWAVMRKTYGYNKKRDRISYGQLSEATGLARKRVFEAVSSLRRKNVLHAHKTRDRSPLTYMINKDYESWLTVPEKRDTPVPENRDNQSVPEKRDKNSKNPCHAGNGEQLSRKSGTDGSVPEKRDKLSRKSGTDLSRFSGTTKYRKDNINTEEYSPEKISGEISSGTSGPTREEYLSGIKNRNVRALVEEALDRIALTRKSGKMAESVVIALLKKLTAFEAWKVGTGVTKYLQAEYYLDGKGENYLLGIVRNVTLRDYHEVTGRQVSPKSSKQSLPAQPRTYAQYQDAERRTMARSLLKNKGDNDEQSENDQGGADQALHSLPGGKTQHGRD